MMKKTIILIISLCVLVLTYGCYNNASGTAQSDKVLSSFSYTEMSLEEAVQESTCAVIGSFSETTDFPNYVYQTFSVDMVLYGTVDEPSIQIFELRTQENMEDIYSVGNQYILLLKKTTPTIYEPEGHYIQTSSIAMFPVDGPYTMYGKELSLPPNESFSDYICSLWAQRPTAVSNDQDNLISVTYGSAEQAVAEESQFLGYVTIDELEYDGAEYTNVYVCSVSGLVKGPPLSTMDNGKILMALTKGEVSVGDTYFIGFNQVDTNSVIYSQSTLTSIILASNHNQIEEILQYLE